MASRTPKFGRSTSMSTLQEQNEDPASSSDSTVVPEEQFHTPTQSSGLPGSHQQLAGIWTRNRAGFSSPWNLANRTDSADNSKLAQSPSTPQKNWLPGLEHVSPTVDTYAPPKELPASSGSFQHHRRNSSRMSSYPDIPSPLAAGLYMRPTFSDGSGLMSPLHSPSHSQQLEKMVKKTPQKLDLHILKVSANAKGSPYHRPKGFGHIRKITDPFVDSVKSGEQSPLPTPFVTEATRKMEHISSFQGESPKSAVWDSPGSTTTLNTNSDEAAFVPQIFKPSIQRNEYVPSMPPFSPLPTMSPIAPDFKPMIGGAPRVDLPIPPPILSSVEGQLDITPVTRAYLDGRAAAREDWIREGAKNIAALSRLSFVAGQQYQKAGTQEDYENWQHLVTAFEEATDLQKRQEERREMFMPAEMRAMGTGAYNTAEDQSASFAAENVDNGGNLVGFRMAYMERICAEVKRRDEEKKKAEEERDTEITQEMINTLSLDEKNELKKHLLGRLNGSSDKTA